MIRLAQPSIPETAFPQVLEVLRSGNLVQGQYVRKFEIALQDYLNIPHAMMVSSGTAALHLALLALDIGPGDEVIVPAFTFPATVNVVELVGATPVLVDITLDDYCLDASRIEQAVTERTVAVMPVHEFGQSADMEAISAVARNYDLHIIEDAACALGTEFAQQKVGTFGQIGCFSLHPRKAITTGEGGILTTADDELAARLRLLRNHGLSVVAGTYDIVRPGYNYRMTEFQAVIGLAQLAEIDAIAKTRRALAREYDRLLGDVPWLKRPARFDNRQHVYQTYHVLIEAGRDRNTVIHSLRADGVETNLGAQAVHCMTYYRQKYHYREDDFLCTAIAYRQGLALPIGTHIHAGDVSEIAALLRKMS